MQKDRSILYVNYSPYENSGHILDYLNENFGRVFLFSIAFHPLGGKRKLNQVIYFENGKITKKIDLYYMPVHPSLVWILIPLRSVINALQIIKETLVINRHNGAPEVFFSVNSFAMFVGMLLKKCGLVNKAVFWVWVYYPMNHPSLVVQLMRWMYWQFDELATYSDRVVYLNNRSAKVRKDTGLISKNKRYLVAPIGMGEILPFKKKNLKKIKIGFIGVLKKSQGLEMLIESAKDLSAHFKDLSFEIIGSGPDEKYLKKVARGSSVKFNFYGLVSEKEFRRILYNSTLGVAPYTPEDSNVSRYGDPGKVKRYLEFNLPSIITRVFEFSKELEKSKAGVVIEYGKTDQLVKAIVKIIRNYKRFCENTAKLHKEYYYKDVYK